MTVKPGMIVVAALPPMEALNLPNDRTATEAALAAFYVLMVVLAAKGAA